MKLKDAKTRIMPKAFVALTRPPLSIHVTMDEWNRITSFKVNANDKVEEFFVVRFNVEAAWKQAESFINKAFK